MASRLLSWNEGSTEPWKFIIPPEQIRDNMLPQTLKASESGFKSGALLTQFKREDVDDMSDQERRVLSILDFQFYYQESRAARGTVLERSLLATGEAFAYYRHLAGVIMDGAPKKSMRDWAEQYKSFHETYKTALTMPERIEAYAMNHGVMCQVCAAEMAYPSNSRPVTKEELDRAKAKRTILGMTVAKRRENAADWSRKIRNKELSPEDLKELSPLARYIRINGEKAASDNRFEALKSSLYTTAASGAAFTLTLPVAWPAITMGAVVGAATYLTQDGVEKKRHTCGVFGGEVESAPSFENFIKYRDRFVEVLRHKTAADIGDKLPPNYAPLVEWHKNMVEVTLCIAIRHLHGIAMISTGVRQKCKNALGRYNQIYLDDAFATESIPKFENIEDDLRRMYKFVEERGFLQGITVGDFSYQLAFSVAMMYRAASWVGDDLKIPDHSFWSKWVSADNSLYSTEFQELIKHLQAEATFGKAQDPHQAVLMAIVFAYIKKTKPAGSITDKDVDRAIDTLQTMCNWYIAYMVTQAGTVDRFVRSALESMECEAGAYREVYYGGEEYVPKGMSKAVDIDPATGYNIACPTGTAAGDDRYYMSDLRPRVCVSDYAVCEDDVGRRIGKKKGKENGGKPSRIAASMRNLKEALSNAIDSATTPNRDPISYNDSPATLIYKCTLSAHDLITAIKSGKANKIKLPVITKGKCNVETKNEIGESSVKPTLRSVNNFYARILRAMGDSNYTNVFDQKPEYFHTPKFVRRLFGMVIIGITPDTEEAAAAAKIIMDDGILTTEDLDDAVDLGAGDDDSDEDDPFWDAASSDV